MPSLPIIIAVIYFLFAVYVSVEVYQSPAIKVKHRGYKAVLSGLLGLVWPVVLMIPYFIGFISMWTKKKSDE